MSSVIFEMIKKEIENEKARSAWNFGVNMYSFELLEHMEEAISDGYHDITDLYSPRMIEKILLNGADNWEEYSWGGCSLIYDRDIALRLCTDTELKRTDNGNKRPNKREQWLDTQARALFQACELVKRATRKALEKYQEEEQEEIPESFIDAIRIDGTASSAG